MKTYFVADAHLESPEDQNYRRFITFIRSLSNKADTLCILGDLFDFRVDLPPLCFREQEPLLEQLAWLAASGTRVVWLEGNHDFHLGQDLAGRLKIEIYTEPVQLELDGRQIFLCHGDLINRADWRYRLLYHTLRNRLIYSLARQLPARLVNQIRGSLQRSSKGRYKSDQKRWDYSAMIREYARGIRNNGADALILGHFHQPFLEQMEDFTLISLGDWISQYSYAELTDGKFRLLTWEEPSD